jgi:hypothetical protein
MDGSDSYYPSKLDHIEAIISGRKEKDGVGSFHLLDESLFD